MTEQTEMEKSRTELNIPSLLQSLHGKEVVVRDRYSTVSGTLFFQSQATKNKCVVGTSYDPLGRGGDSRFYLDDVVSLTFNRKTDVPVLKLNLEW